MMCLQTCLNRLRKRVESVDGVVPGTVILRIRYVGNRPYVEVRLGTPRATSLELAHQLTEVVERAINDELGARGSHCACRVVATCDFPGLRHDANDSRRSG